MSRHDPLLRVRHMLDFAEQAVRLMAGRSRAEFATTETLLLAQARLVELIGEAANRTPQEVLDQIPDIPWRKVIDMRRRLIHDYDLVNVAAIYDVVTADLPVPVRALTDYLAAQ